MRAPSGMWRRRGIIVSTVGGYLHDGTPLAGLIMVMILASSAALYGLAKPTQALHAPA